MKKTKQVVVIGGGIGGLAVANILAKTGYRVSVYENRAQMGGRAGLHEAKGFRFDTGPSWYLMPQVFDHYYELLGEKVSDHLDLVRLDPAYQVFFEDHETPTVIRTGKAANKKLFEKMEPGAGARLERYLKDAALLYELSQKYFLYNNFTTKRSMVNAEVVRNLHRFVRLAFRPMHSHVKQYFKSYELQQIVEYPSVFLGASPYLAPALFSLMSYLDLEEGVFYPQGGMYTIVESLVTIGGKLGVSYYNKSPVSAITTKNGKATGIKLKSGKLVPADIVVSNADLHFTETKLLPKKLQTYPQEYWDKRIPGPSALLMYLGVKGSLPQLQHHNLFFNKDWKKNFSEIFDDHTYPVPASLYVCKPSANDPSVAPKGSENVFVLVPWPAHNAQQPKDLEAYADMYLAQIENMAGIPDLKQRITYTKLYGPQDFATKLNAWNGTALGPAHTLTQSALFRAGNKSKKVSNLYYVGGSTQPGVGVPMCLMSAELVYKYLTNDRSPGPLKTPLVTSEKPKV